MYDTNVTDVMLLIKPLTIVQIFYITYSDYKDHVTEHV